MTAALRRSVRSTTARLPYVESSTRKETADRLRNTARVVDIACRKGDVGWILFPEALDGVVSDAEEIIRSMEPEPVDVRLIFDIGWVMYRCAAANAGRVATAQVKATLVKTVTVLSPGRFDGDIQRPADRANGAVRARVRTRGRHARGGMKLCTH